MKSIKKILDKNYKFKNIFVKELYGYKNLNYFVEADNIKYVLKIYSPNNISYSLFEAENEVMIFLSKKNREIFPRPIKNKFDKYVFEDELNNEKKVFRLITFIEGELFINCKTSDLLFDSFGNFVAKMNSHLLEFKNEFYKNHNSEWDINHALLSKKYIKFIKKDDDRNIVKHFLEQFERHAISVLPTLRKSLIHNDANSQNVLTKDGKVSAIFDFGDVVYSPLINELAVAISYTILERKNPLLLAKTFVKAYHKVLPLKKEEIEILYYLIPARLCTSVCHSSNNKTLNPDNEYISAFEEPALNLLNEWKKINPEDAKKEFLDAII